MTLADTGAQAAVLRAAASPDARRAEFIGPGHPVSSITVPVSGGSGLSLGPPYPGRLLLIGLTRPIRQGDSVPVRLTFAGSAPVTLDVPVIPAVP